MTTEESKEVRKNIESESTINNTQTIDQGYMTTYDVSYAGTNLGSVTIQYTAGRNNSANSDFEMALKSLQSNPDNQRYQDYVSSKYRIFFHSANDENTAGLLDVIVNQGLRNATEPRSYDIKALLAASSIDMAGGTAYGLSGGINAWQGNNASKPVNIPFTVDSSKYDYFFGRVKTGSQHNIQRSAQNKADLAKLGITTNEQLNAQFNKAISGEVVRTSTNNYGTAVTRHVKVGKIGGIDVTFFYGGGDMNSIPKVSTIIPKIYK